MIGLEHRGVAPPTPRIIHWCERGGSVEVYPDDAGAKARAEYIQGLLKGGGQGSEYDYVRGPVLVRVTGDLTPSKDRGYESALTTIN